ncbi:MAG: glycerol dehydratase reactivase beta/small subunit family protein [Negativicutes bacterium]|nr:glycerol dehydratase reactivase beta/small subunit family protein [Negativicutes bacterium]
MPRETGPVKPRIMIYIQPHSGHEAKLREVQAGMEEEGIPCAWGTGEGDATLLAHRGADDSQLEVGVGIASDGMSVHCRKLPRDKPLFLLTAGGNPTAWRHIGCNAARLVKGIPFKPLPGETADGGGTSANVEQWMIDIVRRVIQEKLEGHGR